MAEIAGAAHTGRLRCAQSWTLHPLALLTLQAASIWPVWIWYARRVSDGSDEPWGLAALAAVLLLAWNQRDSMRSQPHGPLLLAGGAVTLLCALATPWLPAMVRAALGVTGLALALASVLDRSRPLLPLWALLLLSLPVIASLQFYAGYPLRLFTAWASEGLLGLFGLAVDREGVALTWAGRAVLVDAPCSGVQMLWVGMFLTALLSWLQRSSALRFALDSVAAFAVVMAANVLRNAVLFVKEAGILGLAQWMHTGVGLAAFLATALAIAAIVRCKPGGRRAERGEPNAEMPSSNEQCASERQRLGPASWPVDMRNAPRVAFVVLILLAALTPLVRSAPPTLAAEPDWEPPWPSTFQGRPLERVPLTAVDRRFAAQFPGHLARFTDGRRQLIVRAMDQPTRLLHPAADCFEGLGYSVQRARVIEQPDGTRWGCFVAEKDRRILEVCERIYDNEGGSWTDVSSWYWAALLGRTRGPWMAMAVASAPHEAADEAAIDARSVSR